MSHVVPDRFAYLRCNRNDLNTMRFVINTSICKFVFLVLGVYLLRVIPFLSFFLLGYDVTSFLDFFKLIFWNESTTLGTDDWIRANLCSALIVFGFAKQDTDIAATSHTRFLYRRRLKKKRNTLQIKPSTGWASRNQSDTSL